MALNKRKVLDAARKHAQKGAKAKALKEYDKLLKADPRDAKLMLEVGDAYRRWGQNEEAIAQYGKVAQQYRQDGFDARAVAVFKQMLNLDAKNYAAFVSLAELYQRMGLDSEAISALQTAADGYHKEGRKSEALELLRQMASLDPTNTTSRLKVAELLHQEGMDSEALSEYRAVIDELENQEDHEQLANVLERILEIDPEDLDALNALVRSAVRERDFEKAEPLAVRALNIAVEPPQYESLMDLYAQMGEEAKLVDATKGLAKLYRERGDEEKARELIQRLPVEEVGSSSRLAVDVSEVNPPDLDDEELLGDDDDFLTLDGEGENPAGEEELELDLEEEIPLETGDLSSPAAEPATAASETPLPEGDPDQLLAEASVYLRYGKREQAIASLKGLLAQIPDHRVGLEKLGEAYCDDGQNSEAVATWTRAAELARADGDADGILSLKARVAELDAAVAEQIAPLDDTTLGSMEDVVDSVAQDVSEAALGDDLDIDVELDFDETDEAGDASATQTSSALDETGENSLSFAEDSFEVEISDDLSESLSADDTEDEPDLSVSEALALGDESETEASGDELFDDDIEFEVQTDDLSLTGDSALDDDELTPPLAADATDDSEEEDPGYQTSAGESTTIAARVNEELEEAEFYIAQEMYEEAEGLLKGILELVPNHPAAMLRMGEVAAARGENPSEAVAEITELGSATVANPFEITARFDEDVLDLDDGGEEEDDDDAAPEEATDAGLHFEEASDADSSEITAPTEELSSPAAALASPEAAEESEEDEVESDFGSADEVTASDRATDEFEVDVNLDVADATTDASDTDSIAEEATASPIELASDESLDTADAGEDSSPDESIEELALDATVEAEDAIEEDEAAADAEESIAAAAEDGADAAASTAEEESVEEPPVDAAESFDLREALADVLDDDATEAGASGANEGPLSTVEDGFESIFSDFKKGVTATLDEGDFDTRYDLGIAYREMGLYEDAISEFRFCLESPDRRFDSLYLMGVCATDMGRFEMAVGHLEQALALPDLPEDRMAGVYFDLAAAHQGTGDTERALVSVRRVLELEPNFPGAAERLTELESAKGSDEPELADPNDGLESFDELFTEEADEGGDLGVASTASSETYESFADVVEEAEAEAPVVAEAILLEDVEDLSAQVVDADPIEGGATMSEGDLEAGLDVDVADVPPIDSSPDGDSGSEEGNPSPKKGRRKKISFV